MPTSLVWHVTLLAGARKLLVHKETSGVISTISPFLLLPFFFGAPADFPAVASTKERGFCGLRRDPVADPTAVISHHWGCSMKFVPQPCPLKGDSLFPAGAEHQLLRSNIFWMFVRISRVIHSSQNPARSFLIHWK